MRCLKAAIMFRKDLCVNRKLVYDAFKHYLKTVKPPSVVLGGTYDVLEGVNLIIFTI